jgi:ABC-type uncharacterized transport system permease subunit
VFVATWLLHSATIAQIAIQNGRFPLSNTSEFLLGLGWFVLSMHLYLWFRVRADSAALVLLPLAALAALGGLTIGSEAPDASKSSNVNWFVFHTTVSTLGLATLCVAFTMSLLYLIQDRALKQKRTLGWLQRLPSLDQCDQVGYHALVLGFILLTIGIGSGIVVNANVHKVIWVGGPKQIFPLLAWLVFAAVLTARSALGFRGRKSAYLTIAGFTLGLMTVVGIAL